MVQDVHFGPIGEMATGIPQLILDPYPVWDPEEAAHLRHRYEDQRNTLVSKGDSPEELKPVHPVFLNDSNCLIDKNTVG